MNSYRYAPGTREEAVAKETETDPEAAAAVSDLLREISRIRKAMWTLRSSLNLVVSASVAVLPSPSDVETMRELTRRASALQIALREVENLLNRRESYREEDEEDRPRFGRQRSGRQAEDTRARDAELFG